MLEDCCCALFDRLMISEGSCELRDARENYFSAPFFFVEINLKNFKSYKMVAVEASINKRLNLRRMYEGNF